jgi:hypothetical protein
MCIFSVNSWNIKREKSKRNQPRVVDHSARGSMKNAANCVQTCELQDTWTPTFWTQMAAWNKFQATSGWGSDIKSKQQMLTSLIVKFYRAWLESNCMFVKFCSKWKLWTNCKFMSVNEICLWAAYIQIPLHRRDIYRYDLRVGEITR